MNLRTKNKISIGVVITASALIPGWAISEEPDNELAALVQGTSVIMEEADRSSVSKIVLLPATAPAGGAVTGSYGKETLGLIDGMDQGRDFGTINQDIAGIPINFPIRILTVPGAILGGLIGASTRELQDYRDALAAKLIEASRTTLSNDALATDVFWRLREVPSLKPKIFALTTPIPADTEAILYVSFSDSTIDVQKDEAILTMSASATLRRVSDGAELYNNQVHYQDRDTLKNWTANDTVAARDFANYARHYLGREISAELYERAEIQEELRPRESNDVSNVKKNQWQGVSKSRTPTLAWELGLKDDDSQTGWAKGISKADIAYDVEIYDKHQIVYAAKKITESQFTLDFELEACKTYRWSVRASYRIGNDVRYGDWMRSDPDPANGNDGKAAAEAAAYIYDFASLEIKCGRR